MDSNMGKRRGVEPDLAGPCPICAEDGGFVPLSPREMMMGTREVFDYRLCEACGSVSIAYAADTVNLSSYYDVGYYSFQNDGTGAVSRLFRRRRDASYFDAFAPIGCAVRRVRNDPLLSNLARVGLRREHRILDVGCGAGNLLNRLASIGFRSLRGVDPFLRVTTTTPNGVILEKAHLQDISGTFDVIMFHHSLEHVPDPCSELSEAAKRLAPDGFCIVRLPTPSSEAFRMYGEEWVQIDAPRHIALPSRGGMKTLAERAGFRTLSVIDDSSSFSFFGSEMVRRDIPFGVMAPDHRDPETIFSPAEMEEFAKRAEACNKAESGDQFMTVLRSSEPP